MKKALVIILVGILVNFANAALVLSVSGPGVTHTGGSNYQIDEGTVATVDVVSSTGSYSGILILTNCPAVASFVNLPPGVSNGAAIGSYSNCYMDFMNFSGGSGTQVSADVQANGTDTQTFAIVLSDMILPVVLDQLNFTIVGLPNSLTLLSPNGGESLTAGTTETISWSSTGSISNVSLEYSDDNGLAWDVITASTANNGQYDWTVPEVTSDECLVRVSDASDAGVNDESDAVFTIYVCLLDSPADTNRDCKVTILDLAMVAADWLKNGNPFDPDYLP